MALKRYNASTEQWELVSAKGQEITVSPTAPASPDVGDIWIDSDEFQTLPSSNSFVSNEVPTGAVNGSNTTYVTAQNYIPGSLEVFVNGLKQASAHVTETTPASGTFNLDVAPATGDVIDCTYQVAADPYSGNADTLDGFHASQTPTAGQIPVLDGDGKLPASIVPKYKIGVIPSATFGSTGNKAITGVGFRPTMVKFYSLNTTNATTANFGEGSMDSTGSQFARASWATSTPTAARMSFQDRCIVWLIGITNPGMEASYVSMDADGFTINVNTAHSAYDIAYEAYA